MDELVIQPHRQLREQPHTVKEVLRRRLWTAKADHLRLHIYPPSMFGIEYSTQRFGLLQIISRGRFCMVLSGRRQIHIQSGPLFKAQIMVKMETFDTIRVGLLSRQLANNAAASHSASGWA